MALPGFKGTTYEVLTGDGARWVISQMFRAEKEARTLADKLLASGQHAMVRITAKRDGWVTERVIFQENSQVTRTIKPIPIAEAPVCATPADCLGHAARLAIGRLGRAYLDERGITAAEFLVSPGDLTAVERRDNFFITGMHLLAKAQASASRKSPSDRADVLFELHEQLCRQTRDFPDDDIAKMKAAIAKRGLAALPEGAPDAPPSLLVLSGLAAVLAEGGSWQGRLAKLIDLLDGDGGSAAARTLVDQLVAELVDAPQAIAEILGGLREGIEACGNLTALATGAGRLPKHVSDVAHRLHALMGRSPLPVTQRILMERVARILGGVKPLTQEGGEAERQAFTQLVPALLDPGGILGGGPTAEALTLRSKMALGQHEDLAMSAAIERLLEMFPTRAVRLGYLLDLTPTPTGRKNERTIRNWLATLISQLKTIRNLMPEDTPPETLAIAVHALRTRLAMEALPEEVRGAISYSLDQLLLGRAPAITGLAPSPAEPPATVDAAGPAPAAAGRILFEEGDDGQNAYLITEGQVDVYRVRSGREEVIATLGRGEIIGEMSLVDGQRRAASARARPGASVVTISRDDLKNRMAALDRSDRLLRLLVEALIRRLRGQSKGPA